MTVVQRRSCFKGSVHIYLLYPDSDLSHFLGVQQLKLQVRNGFVPKLYRHDGGSVYFRVTLSFSRESNFEFSSASAPIRVHHPTECSILSSSFCKCPVNPSSSRVLNKRLAFSLIESYLAVPCWKVSNIRTMVVTSTRSSWRRRAGGRLTGVIRSPDLNNPAVLPVRKMI